MNGLGIKLFFRISLKWPCNSCIKYRSSLHVSLGINVAFMCTASKALQPIMGRSGEGWLGARAYQR